VVDADLACFDTIPHQELMQTLARRIPGSNPRTSGDMLRLIKLWLKAPVETTGGDGRKRLEGGKASRQGVQQACPCEGGGRRHQPVIEAYTYDRVRNFLARRHKLPARAIGPFTMTAVFGELGVPRLRNCRRKGATS
jgi:hypothetical protein